MNKNVLYISIMGMSEPLGKSQVLEYLSDLSNNYSMFLYSFEKDLRKEIINDLSKKMEREKIKWSFQKYSNKHGIFSTIKQIFSSYRELKILVKQNNIKLIHARSLIPVVIALFLKRKFKLKVIFDIRGFQIDEKAEVGRLKKGSILFKLLKKIEHYSYKKSNSIVTLTYASVLYISQYCDNKKIAVIPTCANKQLFKRISTQEKSQFKQDVGYANTDKILLHVGAVSNWYDFDNELKIVSKLMLDDPNLQFLVINKSEHSFISKKVNEFQIDTKRLKVIEVDFYDMYKYLNVVDASIFIIKATFSKTASAPTKFAENLACGLFSITNNGIGDMNKFFQENKTIGYSFDINEIDSNINGICENIMNGMNIEKDMIEYDNVYNEYLSKEMAIKKYSKIYNHLLTEE